MRTAVEKALEELVDVVPAGADGFYYQGQELKDKKCKEVEAFKGIDTLNDILEYKNQLIFVTEDVARDFLEEDEFLIDELVGLDVFDGEKKVGSVVGVSNNGASDLLSVKNLDKKICLVPFVKAIVLSVDIKNRKIQINNLEGLLS